MDNEEWDLEEIKRLKKRNLIQANVIFLFLFVGIPYIASHTTVSTMMTIMMVGLWISCLGALYSFFSGKSLGSQTSRTLNDFERYRHGERKWQRKRRWGIVVVMIFPFMFSLLWIVEDFSNQDSMAVMPLMSSLIGPWIVINIGEMLQISRIEEEDSDSSE